MLLVLGGYLLGTFPTAVVVARRRGHDTTTEGSGNPGATNVYRTVGRRAGAVVLAGDAAKGAIAAAVGWLAGGHLVGVLSGAAAVAGHVLPLTRRFHGGKGMATTGGAVLVLFPIPGVVAAVVWAMVAKLTRRASVASLLVAVGIPAGAAVAGAPGVEIAVLVAMGVLVVVRHADNIGRLLRGTERPVEGARR